MFRISARCHQCSNTIFSKDYTGHDYETLLTTGQVAARAIRKHRQEKHRELKKKVEFSINHINMD